MLRAVALAALTLPGAAQSVWVVDATDGPGTDFTTLWSAIDAASEGDVLLVRPGVYGAVIDGKSLVLLGDGATLPELSSLEIRGIDATQLVAVRGLEMKLGTAVLEGCAGTVLLEDWRSIGLWISHCEDVVLRNAELTGNVAVGMPAGGIDATESDVFVYDSSVRGLPGFLTPQGSPAVILDGGSLWLHGSSAIGGDGSGFFPCGGAGIRMAGAAPLVRLLDSIVQGGSGGCGQPGSAPAFDDVSTGGVVIAFPGIGARSASAPSPLREGQATSVTFEGEPGDLCWLLLSARPVAAHALPPILGFCHADTPFQAVISAQIPAGGVLQQPFVAPLLPPGLEIGWFSLQGLFRGAGGGFQFGGPIQVHVLDQAL